ncbi:MAG: 4Fe-4S dicluster domain-containing protein [Deferribacteres bacterium]|nr:4Fe-4S dicluster domain-containing protein [Deferribacteres bacterium]
MTDKRLIKTDDIKKAADEKKCPLERALFYMTEFLAGPMCGKCFPCSMGSYEARVILNNMIEGKAAEEDLSKLRRIASDMLDGSMCKKGKDTARFMLQWLDTGDFDRHVEGICPERTCGAYIEYTIITAKCTMCGECLTACKYGAIYGEKRRAFISGYQPFEIRQTKCVKCGECVPACPEKAIAVVDAKVKEAETVGT